jgi:hypothetical protein
VEGGSDRQSEWNRVLARIVRIPSNDERLPALCVPFPGVETILQSGSEPVAEDPFSFSPRENANQRISETSNSRLLSGKDESAASDSPFFPSYNI